MQEHLSKELANLRIRVAELTLQFVIATRTSDRDLLRFAQEHMDKALCEWDSLNNRVAQLERVSYNTAELLAVSQDEDD